MVSSFYCYRCKKGVSAQEQSDGNYRCNECHDLFVQRQDVVEPPLPRPVETLPRQNQPFSTTPSFFQRLPNGFSLTFNQSGTSGNRVGSNFINSVLSQLFNISPNVSQGDFFDGNLDQLLNVLMQNDTNRYGPPPTSRGFIKNMVHRRPTSSELSASPICSVCDCDVMKDDTVVCLPCKHIYHPDCILPWIKKHNTCPTCRAELPSGGSDDEEEEEEEEIGPITNYIVC